jgi:mannose-6-phosphate isomerase-like protein (cupin superfamily)
VTDETQEARPFIVSPRAVRPFSLDGDEGKYRSRNLIGPHGANSKNLLVNHFTVLVGNGMSSHVHPRNDELYYILAGEGVVELGGHAGLFEFSSQEVGKDDAIFIPAGTFHRIENTGDLELILLTIWPHLPYPGDNPIYDGRLAAWGSSFELCPGNDAHVESK